MKIHLEQVLKDYRGMDVEQVNEEEKNEKFTVRLAINSAVNGIEVTPDGRQKPLTAKEKGKIYQLSNVIWGAKNEVELTVDDVSFIKKRMDAVSNTTPLVYGRLLEILEGKDGKKGK